MSRRIALVALALVLIFSREVRADGAFEAGYFDEIGRRAYAKGAYADALGAFLLVNGTASSAGSLYNVAVSAELAGKPDIAFTYYQEYLAVTDVDRARRADVERRLERLQKTLALVEIASEPPGAEIHVDRRELGVYGKTPRLLALPAGEHHIALTLEGFGQVEGTTEAKVGQTVGMKLRLEPRMGEIGVVTDPPGATVEFLRASELVAASLDHGRYRLPVGAYVARIRPRGRLPVETRVVIREAEPSSVTLVAPPLPAPTGKLLVSTGSLSATVYVDGERRAVTPAVLPKLEVGKHDVSIVARGHRTVYRKVVIEAGRATYLGIALTPVREGGP